MDWDRGAALVREAASFWQGSDEFSPWFKISSLPCWGTIHLLITGMTASRFEAFFEPNSFAAMLYPIPAIQLFRIGGMTYGTQPSWDAYQRREL